MKSVSILSTQSRRLPFSLRRLVNPCAALLSIPFLSSFADDTWDGDVSNVWSVDANWGTAAPGVGENAIFSGAGNGNTIIDLGLGVTINHLQFLSANVAAYTIGAGGVGNQTLRFDSSGGIDTDGAVTRDITIAANIILGDGTSTTFPDGFRIDPQSTTNRVIIAGDIDTGTGTASPGAQRLEIGDFTGTSSGGRLVQIDGDIFETGDATLLQLFVAGADLIMNGNVIGTGNTQRTYVRNGSALTVGATGNIGQGALEVRHGSVSFNNATTPQLLDDGLIFGDAAQGDGDSFVAIADGATVILNSTITYYADDNTTNLGTLSGGILKPDVNFVIMVNDHSSVAETSAELTISSSIIDDNDGGRSLSKRGAGTLLLTASNNQFSFLVVDEGRVQITNSGAIGTNDIQLGSAATDGTLEFLGTANDVITRQVRVGHNGASSTGQAAILNNGSGELIFSNPSFNEARTANVARTLTLGGSNIGDNIIAGTIIDNSSGTVGISKEGGGRWILQGDNTYKGTTAITAGTLQIDGTQMAATGSVSIGAAGTLAGNGTVGGLTSTVAGAVIQPGGDGGADRGILNFAAGLNASTATLDLSVLNNSNRGTSYDALDVAGGALTLNAGTFIMVSAEIGFSVADGDSFDLLDWASIIPNGFDVGTNLRDGSGDAGTNLDLPDLSSFSLKWDVSNFLVNGTLMAVIPEPSRVALLLVAGMGSTLRRRRQAVVDPEVIHR